MGKYDKAEYEKMLSFFYGNNIDLIRNLEEAISLYEVGFVRTKT